MPKSSTIVYRLINKGISVHCLYGKNTAHVRIVHIYIYIPVFLRDTWWIDVALFPAGTAVIRDELRAGSGGGSGMLSVFSDIVRCGD